MERRSLDEDTLLWPSDSSGQVYRGHIGSTGPLRETQNDGESGEAVRLDPISDKLDAKATVAGLGEPTANTYVQVWDISAFVVSLMCCVLATISVSNEYLAWRLRVNNQLIVVGALLSVMNLCLDQVSTATFLLLEARFGRSTLANYDGILRKQAFGARVGVFWRTILICTVVLPIGLSVAYKQYQIGGTSATVIDATDVTQMAPEYGLFSTPGFASPNNTGNAFSMYFNATLPLRVASDILETLDGKGLEPPLSNSFPQNFGANMLLQSATSAVMLDMPTNTRLRALQQWLRNGDSMNITAPVFGTAASRNVTMAVHDDPDFQAACVGQEMELQSTDLYNDHKLHILAKNGTADYSRLWLGFTPASFTRDPPISEQCSQLAQSISRYDIVRVDCFARWSITRGGIQVVDGACLEPLPPLQQIIIKSNPLELPWVWPVVLAESMIPFSSRRTQSRWADPVAAATVAAMIWSSVTGLNSPAFIVNATPSDVYHQNLTLAGFGLLYELPQEEVASVRPTLARSAWLYVVFAVQPALILAMIVASITLSSTPIGPGFGIVSLLAGIDGASLQYLKGASLSGKLRQDPRLDIVPIQEPDGEMSISYRINAARGRPPKARLRRGVRYS